MSEKIKILFCGDVEGKFDTLFKRVKTIHEKSGPFDQLLCVSNFFGINNKEFIPYKLGEKKAPIPTYILGPNKEDQLKEYPEDESQFEICHNIYYLGKRGIYSDSKGLKIAYVSGIANTAKSEPWTYNEKDISDLCDISLRGNPSFRGVDVLLTSQWPDGVIHENKVNLTINMPTNLLSFLCMKLRPRYIISGLEGVYYERPPFRCPSNDNDSTLETVTRFIGLARVGNPNKDKWIYALNVTPLDKMKIAELIQKTTDETPCPFDLRELEAKLFKDGAKRKSSQPNQYFYDMNASMDDHNKKQKFKKQKVEFDQSKCWFCLASPTVEKHLVITVGNCCYLTLAKGGIVEEHFLICPMEHFQSSLACTEDIRKEMGEFKEALRNFYARKGQVPVFSERNYKTSHMQLQVVPIPEKAARELKDIFLILNAV
ncbi:CWF19-like protein 1 homolog isoform X2 [Anthonomus grandis grandis]|uniref:CWF19-like protein 1 homolog isoform X2 n=1 Tax=Anthonomus grandis grandis TaxID=2921223 RepID=UPI002165ACB7|nr:CWF19-like protein 1 homolog isoform X2 [Anthonomus grandis grandis]